MPALRSMRIVVFVATWNRPFITELSLRHLRRIKPAEVAIVACDDCSSAYDAGFLRPLVDEVVRMPEHGGIERLRARNFRDFIERWRDFDLMYTTDNDTIHDPAFAAVIAHYYDSYRPQSGPKLPISLFNSRFHAQADNALGGNAQVEIRKTAPGVSQVYDREMAERIVQGLNEMPQLETEYGYDYYFPLLLRRPFIQSRVSYLEHFGRDRHEVGLHTRRTQDGAQPQDDFDYDRALQPTPWLESIRPRVIEYLLGDGSPPTLD